MFLSDRDLELAIKSGQLLVDPAPTDYDTTSIDLHLDRVEEAKVWNVAAFEEQQKKSGNVPPLLRPGRFVIKSFGPDFYMPVPEDPQQPVYRNGRAVIVKPGGFFLWQTREKVGTPEVDPRLICFIDGKSSGARTGLLVHMTAPTIHAGWWGKITLEIANLGPFNLSLHEFDAVSQLTVAVISSPPIHRKKATGIDIGQSTVAGQASS